jgi:hypothetical protein
MQRRAHVVTLRTPLTMRDPVRPNPAVALPDYSAVPQSCHPELAKDLGFQESRLLWAEMLPPSA